MSERLASMGALVVQILHELDQRTNCSTTNIRAHVERLAAHVDQAISERDAARAPTPVWLDTERLNYLSVLMVEHFGGPDMANHASRASAIINRKFDMFCRRFPASEA